MAREVLEPSPTRLSLKGMAMTILHWLLSIFLFPGTLALQVCGISLEEDGGLFRSFVNMCVWGAVSLGIALAVY